MEENNNKSLLKKLLDRLQEDSWQLELLVSGFTIFGLFYALESVGDAFQKAMYDDSILKDVYQTVLIAINILIFNLILHVILRSMWIGALGLRYLSGEVEIDKLKYSQRFTNYLKKKIGSFDDYIEKLEKLCSIIFAISFLLIFYVAAFFIILHLLNFIGSLGSNNASILLQIFVITTQVLLLLGAFLTFFDYITQGLLKKNKWVATVYFPFYWVFSYLTLSFLYRPLYYNLIDNKFGRKVSLLLLPLYILIMVISSRYKEQSTLTIFDSSKSNSILSIGSNYEDLIEKNDLFISTIAIQSRVIVDPYIKIKIPLSDSIEEHIFEFNEGLKPEKDKRGYKSFMSFKKGKKTSSLQISIDSLRLEYMKTFQKIYTLKIDSVTCKSDFVMVKESNRKDSKYSFETYIGTNNLVDGKHILLYSRYKHVDSDSVIIIREIPFWYYKDQK